MYNVNIPPKSELPTTRKLIVSTVIAIAVAALLLITVVLPAEYAIDPTGFGQLIGLTKMGRIKNQLAAEAKSEQSIQPAPTKPVTPVIATASSQPASDYVAVTLKPDQAAEIKMEMLKGAKLEYSWAVQGGVVNFDNHGDMGSQVHSYKKGKATEKDSGTLEAAFDGNHGWYWRNRGSEEVTITLSAKGQYKNLKRMM